MDLYLCSFVAENKKTADLYPLLWKITCPMFGEIRLKENNPT